MNQKRPIAVDLFAGAGGMTLGFEQAGFDVLASVEIDPIHCIIHEYNFPFCTVICRSLENVSAREIRALSKIGNQTIDVVFGGPPCQGFSLIGKRCLEDERNALIKHFIRLVLELQPKYFVIENVPGMAIGKHQKFLEEIFDEFREIGYQVHPNYRILNAANYGVPQNRERLFLIGSQLGLPLPNYPQIITEFKNNKVNETNINILKTPTVLEAIQDLPEANNYPELNYQDWVITDYGEASNYGKKLRNLSKIDDDYSYKRDYDFKLLTGSLRTNHNQTSIYRFAKTPQGKIEPVSRFYKLHPDGLCNTLRAGTPSNRGAHTSPRPIHPFTPRCITVREAARLHSYPDWFRFHVTKWHGFRQIGNSVPPLLAKAVAEEIIKILDINPLKSNAIYYLENEQKYLSFNLSQASQYYGVDPKIFGTRIRKNSQEKQL
ncbi:DNA cytosine methyltransferase [Aphanothece sacrum]|uniref:Cytosine-specific methyltransferase n=1 Tax=Aphanothece sacrum FPU1 TaxID=1920663 RepID=A0A401II07_APHSA|nr:DNA cytosine methyltransferase [Aphanothece sacrum]GBF80933.1 cytosine-specific methyltransferase [Aphanothece sacrum FPU1]GBF85240.1 cytosine-specific methyltransferase [Aphanothece sacrum FPU3]